MGMTGLVFGAILGMGALLIFDRFSRPEREFNWRRWAARLGPRGLGAAAGAVVAYALTGWETAAFAGGVLGAVIPVALVRARSERDRLRRMEAVAEVSARIRDALRSGIGIQDAIAQAARRPPVALESYLRRLVSDAKVGGLGAAAAAFADRLGDPAADLFASALTFSERLGSRDTSELLDSLAESTSARAATLREARVRQTRNRVSAQIVAVAPIVLLLGIKHANPAFLEPFDTASGQMVMVAAFGMIAGGYLLMLRMARIERRAR
jgi:tight adherence protein B